VRTPKLRQSLLIAVVLLLPSAAIVIQGIQLDRYEVDLAQANLAEAQAEKAREIGRRAIALLERVELTAAQPGLPDGIPTAQYDSSIVRLTGVEEAGELKWPWDFESSPQSSAQNDPELVFAQARAFPAEQAHRTYASLMASPSQVRDAYDVPYWTYAAVALLNSTPESARGAILDRISSELSIPSFMTDLREAQLQRVLETIGETDDAESRQRAKALTERLEMRKREYDDFRSIQRAYASMSVTDRVWQAWQGNSLWLIGKTLGSDGSPPQILAVDARRVGDVIVDLDSPEPGALLGTQVGLPLSERLADLRVAIPAGSEFSLASSGPEVPSFYQVTVFLAISLAGFGGYFLWRDAKRDAALVQLRSQFVSGVTHEIKTPLTSIRMFAETLQIADETGAATPEKRIEYLETIIRESERLTRLLNNVLAYSQIERGQRTYHMQQVHLQDVVDEAARMMLFPMSRKGLSLNVSFSEEVPAVEADRDALKQAVLNLLSNAVKYSGESNLIELKVYRQETDAVISVSDQGIGIPEAELQRIFESFYRVTANGSDAIGGTGLGLSIVDHIARAHGGSVSVESRVGEGSTFHIRIPIHRETIA